MRRSRSLPVLLAVLLCFSLSIRSETKPKAAQRVLSAFNTVKANRLDLHAFLAHMPKGADLHMHLSGAIYAESFLAQAIADGICIDTRTLSLAQKPPCTRDREQIPASALLSDQKLYDAMVDSFSMRGFVPTPGTTGHDQFFATFARFGGLNKEHAGEWLDEVASRAAAQNEQYLEIMQSPSFTPAATVGRQLGWPGTTSSEASPAALAQLREKLLASAAFRKNIADDQAELAEEMAARNRIEHCGTPAAAPGCSIQVRFLGQVLRAFPAEQVFAQTLLYFELASVDPNVVGINYVQPEDAYMAMSEYHRQMLMLDYLHGVYPKVHISLHAGELASGMVPPEGLRFHIREAVQLGHAERIGHGVDVMQEDDPRALLKEMADRHVMVEINLTSNDVILGVRANDHSLPAYRTAHVPVALSTDDEGVSRIDLTHEYTRAVVDFGLGYLDLKNMARTSLEHSFLAGASLWQQTDNFTHTIAACAGQLPGTPGPATKCLAFLKSSDKATQQWELERRYQVFESTLP